MSGPDCPAGQAMLAAPLPAAHPLSGNRTGTFSAQPPRPRGAPPLAVILSLALAACATVEPPPKPEVRTNTVEVRVPVPVPCFTEAERPIRPQPTPIDIANATVDQMAAAIAADDLADELYARAVDALFILCMKRIADGTATQPVGGKP